MDAIKLSEICRLIGKKNLNGSAVTALQIRKTWPNVSLKRPVRRKGRRVRRK